MKSRGTIARAVLVGVAVLAVLTGSVAHASDTPPPNDNFAAAQVIDGAFGDTSGSAAAATAEPGEPSHGDPIGADDNGIPTVDFPPTGQYGGCCDNPAAHSVWFAWTAPFGGTVSFSTTGSDYDTTLSVYRPHDPAQPAGYGNLAVVAGNDDCHLGGSGGVSCVKFEAVGGATYWIAVDWAQQGPPDQYELRWLESLQNDSLATAFSLGQSTTTIVGSNTNATNDPSDPVIAGTPGGASVWYRWTPGAKTVTLGTSGSCTASFDLLLGLYTQAPDGSLVPVPGGQLEIPKGQALTAAFIADGQTSYVIVVEGVMTATQTGIGTFCLRATQTNGGNLNLDKRVSPALAHPGQPLDYTLTVSNPGPGPGLGIVVTDPAPNGTSVVSAPGCTLAASTLSCPVARLDPGRTATFAVRLLVAPTVLAGTVISNTASVASLNDPDPSDDSATATASVENAADLSVTAAVASAAFAGDTLTYTLSVANVGPNPAANARVTDTLPTGATLTIASTGCGVAGGTLTCPLGTLAPGAHATLALSVSIPPVGAPPSLANVATVGSDTFDPDMSNNTATSATSVSAAADLALTKTASVTARAGDPISYTLTVTNNGPSAGEQVQLTDPLPPDLTLAALSGDPRCSLAAGTVTCVFGTLAPGATVTLSVAAMVSTNTARTSLSNTATVTTATHDPNLANNTATAVTTVIPNADLGIAPVSVPANGFPGSQLDYAYTVTNSGPGPARAQVVDVLPADTTLLSATSGCALSGTTIRCALGTLASGASVPVSISLAVSAVSNATSISNTASVSSLDFNDPNLVNNATTATTPIVQVSCPVAGSVQANQTWQGVHVELQGDCDLDRRTGNVYLHHAKLTVTVDGGPPLIQAKEDGKRSDFKQVAITGTDDAIITGVSGGTPFIVNLHDGGSGNHGDTVRVRYGSLDTSVLSTKHGEVHIRRF